MNASPPGSKPVLDNNTLSLIQMLAFLDGDGVPLSLFLVKERDDMSVFLKPINHDPKTSDY